MSKNGKIAVGIIGAGNIAGQHIPGYLQAAEHVQVAAIGGLIRRGRLGKVYAARTTEVFALKGTAETFGWRARRETSGGGELIDTGYHPNYLLLHLVDSLPMKVTALLSRHRLLFLEGEDTAHVLVEFADGAIGSIVTGWAYEPAGCTERFSVAG